MYQINFQLSAYLSDTGKRFSGNYGDLYNDLLDAIRAK